MVIYPSGRKSRIRSLENHNKEVKKISAGMRTAINLGGIEKSRIKRGDVVAEEGTVTQAKKIDVSLTMLKDSPYVIKNASRLHFYHGSDEKVCKVRLMDKDELKKGEWAYAQLRFEKPISVRNNDRFVIRFFSPVATIGGGRILNASPRNHKRNNEKVLESFKKLDSCAYKDRLEEMIRLCGAGNLTEERLLVMENISKKDFKPPLKELLDEESIKEIDGIFIHKKNIDSLKKDMETILKDYHRENPLRMGMNMGQLREICFKNVEKGVSDRLIRFYADEGFIRIEDDAIALSSFEPGVLEGYEELERELKDYYRKCGVFAPSAKEAFDNFSGDRKAFDRITERMRKRGELIVLTEKFSVGREGYEKALGAFKEMAKEKREVKLIEFKEKMEFSRKFSQMYLEYWDRVRITRRIGEAHVLRVDGTDE